MLSDVLEYLKTAPGVDKLLPMSAKLQSLGDSSVTIGVTVFPTPTPGSSYAVSALSTIHLQKLALSLGTCTPAEESIWRG